MQIYVGSNLKQNAMRALLSLQRFSWEQGVTVQAAYECEEYALLAQLVKSALFRINEEGRPAQMGYEGSSTDACCIGEGLVYLAKHAKENGYDAFSTTLLVSPYQNHEELKKLGEKLAKKYEIEFIYRDFRVGFREGQNKARELELYMQKYCGCVFSEEDRYSQKIAKDIEKFKS